MRVVLDLSTEPPTLVIHVDRKIREDLRLARQLPTRKFDAETSTWQAPLIIENEAHFAAGGQPLSQWFDHPAIVSGYGISMARENLFKVSTPGNERDRCKRIPEYRHYSDEYGAYVCKVTRRNVEYLMRTFPQAKWSKEATVHRVNAAAEAERVTKAVQVKADFIAQLASDAQVVVTDYKFGTVPYEHQKAAFLMSREPENFALLMQQGTGKTKVIIDTVYWLYLRSLVKGALVISPNSVKEVWDEEITLHSPDYIKYRTTVYSSGMKKAECERLEVVLSNPVEQGVDWLIMNVEAFSSKKGGEIAMRFLKSRSSLITIDEATRIKTPGAKRTKNIMKLRPWARYRRILTGTPVTNGPLDVFSPFKFLSPDIIGYGSYYSFRNHFATMGGWNGKEVTGYQHIDELTKLLDPHSYRVLREDCLDLPEKVYQKLIVEMAPEQKRIYDRMRNEMIADMGEREVVTTTMVLTQLLRLQQIAGGFLGGIRKVSMSVVDAAADSSQISDDDLAKIINAVVTAEPSDGNVLPYSKAIAGPNPKVAALLEVADDVTGKVVVWSRFRQEIKLIADSLREKYGEDSVVEFHGGVNTADRKTARLRFQDPKSPVRFFIGNQAAGGLGITLTQAQTVVYYSNTFSLEDRLQSEDRVHRIGQDNTVTYIDLVIKKTVDVKLIKALRNKQGLANQVTGDTWKEWI